MTTYEIYPVHCLEKVLPDRRPEKLQPCVLRGFANETLSVQVAYTCTDDAFGEGDTAFDLGVESPVAQCASFRSVRPVPCSYPCHGTWDSDYLSTKPGLYPDLLLPLETTKGIRAIPAQWRSIWVDFTGVPAGEHTVTLLATDKSGVLARMEVRLEMSDGRLPEQSLYHTEWFHADCLADYYGVEVFSEEHWRILDNFIASAASHGVNTLLTPVFTPPLDTGIGGERTTVQLVQITKTEAGYDFDFSLLKRWMSLCKTHGITHLEMPHLFSQWGAVYAPKIIVKNGTAEEQAFGWHTPVSEGSYIRFLREFLPALCTFLREEDWFSRTVFHISDEPHEEEAETYAFARNAVIDLLADCRVMDAISAFAVFEKGIIDHPVVSIDAIHPFLDAGIRPLWAYHCTMQAVDVPNRFIVMPSARNRILGTLLYYYEIEGFLHWGFNFYNSKRSVEKINPYLVTDAGEAFPSGDAFLVYPAPDGSAYESLRGMTLKQALYDYRALKLAESKIGRMSVLKKLDDLFGRKMTFTDYPREISFFEKMRESLQI
ncbi:MAG: DUF4091 domain-containing protein [Lachnospiraceae bacterium]|nr:DUF4091 domain-containing protein [Lachnospiraceae bacterium]